MKLRKVAAAVFAGAAAALLLLGAPAQAGGHGPSGGPGDDDSTQKGVVAVDDTLPILLCDVRPPIGGIGLVGVQVPIEVPIGSGNQAMACANNGSHAEASH